VELKYDVYRIALGKQAFMNKKKLFTGNLGTELKNRIVKSVLWSVLLYASETWTMTQADRKRLEVEMRIYRRMKTISLVYKISNEEVLQRVNETKSMLDTVRKCKHVRLWHVPLLHDRPIMGERMRGKGTRCRKRMHHC